VSLSGIYLDLWRTAQETGRDAARELHGGARLAVRVIGDVTTLTIARKTKRVGDVELRTFVRDCGVPDAAIRFPQEGQNPRERDGLTWWSVSFRWREDGHDES
jgi:hypothetical protein